jgi:hypothetical protein
MSLREQTFAADLAEPATFAATCVVRIENLKYAAALTEGELWDGIPRGSRWRGPSCGGGGCARQRRASRHMSAGVTPSV